jgi:drug/metabolite transporter (DMT)-like permease
MRHPLRLPPAVLLIVACALWGGATVLNKAVLMSIPPVTLLVLQLGSSAAVLWIAICLRGVQRPEPSAFLPLMLLGVLNPGISYTLNLMGLALVSASVTTLLWAAEPMLILAIAALILREPVTFRLVFVMVAGMAGAALVTDVIGDMDSTGNDPSGIALLLSAVLCCAFYTVFSRKLSERTDPTYAVALQQTAGLVWASSLLLMNTGYGSLSDLPIIPWTSIAAAAVSGLLYYAVAYWLYIAAIRFVPAAVAGSYFNVIPVFGVGLAFIFLGERLTPVQWAGALAILLSVIELVRLTGKAEANHAAKG